MVMTILKSLTTIKCNSDATCFDGQADAPVQYRAHRPMKGVHGYPGSQWTLPPGEYSRCIAPAAARATANKTTIKKCTILPSRFDSCADAPVQYRAHRPIEVVQGFD
jgi:hypothetical protein